MTHYKMNRLHLGCGESLSTYYRRSEPVARQDKSSVAKTQTSKKTKSTRQLRGS